MLPARAPPRLSWAAQIPKSTSASVTAGTPFKQNGALMPASGMAQTNTGSQQFPELMVLG
jgi:hypothetical protein